uniref:Proline-rich protein 15 n=4 Tax=Bos TaxID=9903 RepID=A0A8C0A3H1_BOSMU
MSKPFCPGNKNHPFVPRNKSLLKLDRQRAGSLTSIPALGWILTPRVQWRSTDFQTREKHKPLASAPSPQPARERPGQGRVDPRAAAAAEALPRAPRPAPLGRPAMADGSGTGSSGSWWNSLTNSRKKNKEAAGGAQPPAQPAPGEPAPPVQDWTSSSRENQHPSLLGGAGEPHKLDKLGGEKSGNSRRNLKISRSGRFKEKRKVRATLLPEGVRSSEEAIFPGDPHDDKQ